MLDSAILSRAEIRRRLLTIFPDGAPHRGYCTRELAASTVFTALYVGAIEGAGVYFAPKHVYRMTEKQAGRTDRDIRLITSHSSQLIATVAELPSRKPSMRLPGAVMLGLCRSQTDSWSFLRSDLSCADRPCPFPKISKNRIATFWCK